jgi:hypothetical protein
LHQLIVNSAVHDVTQLLLGKAAGSDGVFKDAFLYGDQRFAFILVFVI